MYNKYLDNLMNILNSIDVEYDNMQTSITNHNKDSDVDDKKQLLEEIEGLKVKLLQANQRENESCSTKRMKQGTENEVVDSEEIENKKCNTKHLAEEKYQNEILRKKNIELESKNETLHGELQRSRRLLESLQEENTKYRNITKQYKDELLDLKGSIRVFVRINGNNTNSLVCTNTSVQIDHNGKKLPFVYDKVFSNEDNQNRVYKELQDTLESVIDGYKICIFAYGQTGSGKTYTMIGKTNDEGLLYRSVDMLFEHKKYLELTGYTVGITCTFVEIYNETVRDLFNLTNLTSVPTSCELHDHEHSLDLIATTIGTRMTGSTNCNEQSSRSHLICNIKVRIQNDKELREGSLCFIDLAGSERLKESHATGDRLKETQNINRSLSSLGDIFMALLNNSKHIPYRNSKLTYALSEYLQGKSRVAMILNVSGRKDQMNETISTLRFGAKISSCKLGKVEQNIVRYM